MPKRALKDGVLPMEKIRQILRLKELGLTQRALHRASGVARSTIQEYLRMFELHGLTYERACGVSDEELKKILRKKTPGRSRAEVAGGEPDFAVIHKELFRARA